MGTTAEKLTYLNETKNQLKTVINYAGAGLTTETFRQYPEKLYDKYLDILKDGGAELFSTLPQVTGSGTSITLNNTVNTKIDLELKPSALEQATTTGKNLNFTPYANGTSKTTNGITFSVDDEGKVIANDTATSTAYFYLHTHDISPYWNLPQDTYIISGCPTGGGNSTYQMGFRLYNNMTQVAEVIDEGNGVTIDTTSYTYNRIMLYIAVFNGQQCDNLTFKPMVRKASITDGSFEPYTNGPSPNPSYPQTVHSISGDNTIEIVGKNLFNYTSANMDNVGFNSSTGALEGSNTRRFTTRNQTYLKAGTYTLSFTTLNAYWILVYGTDNTFKANYIQSSWANGNTKTFTLNEDCLIRIALKYQNDGDVTVQDYNIQIEKNTSATTYVEHEEQSLPLTLGTLEVCKISSYEDEFYMPSGKNLIDVSQTEIGKAWNNGSNSARAVCYIKCEPNTKYTISFSNISGIDGMYNFEKDSITATTAIVGVSQITATKTITTNANSKYLGIQFNKSSISLDDIEAIKLQIEKGETSSTYEPYNNGKWYLKKNIGKVVLDGSEVNWTKSGNTSFDRYLLGNNIGGIVSAGGYSNYFKMINANIPSNLYEMSNNGNSQLVFNYAEYNTTDLTIFKTWLSTHNTDVYYVLTTPDYVSLNDTLQKELNDIKKAVSYDTQTNISQTNSDLSFVINATAIEKNGGA